MDKADPLEFRMLAKESFMKKPAEMVPIPESIREVLFRFNWDKVLVDVRRTVEIVERGKQEVYTAMVAVGNLNGLLGLGLGDAATAQDAVARAHMDSYSNLAHVPLYRGHTIYHRIDHDFHRMKVSRSNNISGGGRDVSLSSTDASHAAPRGLGRPGVRLGLGAVRAGGHPEHQRQGECAAPPLPCSVADLDSAVRRWSGGPRTSSTWPSVCRRRSRRRARLTTASRAPGST